MSEHLLFLTGKLAENNLRSVLGKMQGSDFTYQIRQLGVSVAALMTTDMIARRIGEVTAFDGIVIPGRCRGDIDTLSIKLGVPVRRGPDELKDIPVFFGHERIQPDLSRHDTTIFAEIVDAPYMSIDEIVAQAGRYGAAGADVIDIGCLPDTPFPHLEQSVIALREQGYRVSVDSMNSDELLRGGHAGADYLLSLTTKTLWIAHEVPSIPVIIPAVSGDLDSLTEAMNALDQHQLRYIVDPILDPIQHGFTESLVRYRNLRRKHPDVEILMGIGNVTELTDADTAGINAVLFGIASELGIRHILTTQVSPHARCAVAEADVARRMMYAARANSALPRDFHSGLLALHERSPFPYEEHEINELARQIRDPSYRIQISTRGVHIFNRDGMHTSTDIFQLLPHLDVQTDGPHAFYLGAELARAEIAWQLGKRYSQDSRLQWGCVSDDMAAPNEEPSRKT